MSRNQLGVGNTKAISEEALRNNHTLKQLLLNGTRLPNEVILAIANALAGESALKVIGMETTVEKYCLALLAS